jgi:hypothetical protein
MVNLTPAEASRLGARAETIEKAARVFALFGEEDPALAAACGVEIGSLEARTLLSGGAGRRIASAASESVRAGRQLVLGAEDLEALSRLEAVVALGSARIALQISALDEAEGRSGMGRIGDMIGMVTGAVGLYKAIF